MRYKLINLLLVAVLLFSCGKRNNIEKGIRNKIKEDCNSKTCIIPLSQVTDFKWDKMYVFNHPTAPDIIDKAIGMHYPHYVEFTRSIIFLNKNVIVHFENNYSNVEGPTDGEILFDYPDSLDYQVYKPEQSIFKINRKTSKNITYYILSIK